MKLIAKHRKSHFEWTFFDLGENKELERFKKKDHSFIPSGRYIIMLRIYDMPTGFVIHEYEVLSKEYPCGYNFDFPKEVSKDTPFGEFLGSNQFTWFPKDSWFSI